MVELAVSIFSQESHIQNKSEQRKQIPRYDLFVGFGWLPDCKIIVPCDCPFLLGTVCGLANS